jgi:hypothetical protein
VRKLCIDAEYRRHIYDQTIEGAALGTISDVRGWYVAGVYRFTKRLELGSYYSRYAITSAREGPLSSLFPDQSDTSLPINHVYDKVVTARRFEPLLEP